MWLRKRSAGIKAEHDGDLVAVLVEAMPGHNDAEVVDRLRTISAHRITVLAPGFVSAEVKRERIKELEDIAEVGIKPQKRPLAAMHEKASRPLAPLPKNQPTYKATVL